MEDDVRYSMPGGTPKARTTDPSTSWRAAASIADIRDSQAKVWYVLRVAGDMADAELVPRFLDSGFKMSPSGIRSRRKELVDAGLVVDSGHQRTLPSGRSATVWHALSLDEWKSAQLGHAKQPGLF